MSLGNLASPGRSASLSERDPLPGVPSLRSGMHAKGQGVGAIEDAPALVKGAWPVDPGLAHRL